MARKMKQLSTGSVIEVKEHIITRNFWEYFVTTTKTGYEESEERIVEALVMGFETELGDVSLKEIGPYIISRTRKLDEVIPASGWAWEGQ